MAKSDARFGYQANLGRNDFDLSQRFGFTSASGMLLPIWYDFAHPGDAYYITHDLPLLRSSVLLAPAMVDVKVHFETFFVPIQMIYEPAEVSLYELKEQRSSNFVISNLLTDFKFPLFDYSTFVSTVLGSNTYINSDLRADAYRLADLLGLCPENFLDANQNTIRKYSPSFFPYQLCVYHCIYEYYYRLDDKSQFDNRFFNIDKFYANTTAFTMLPPFMQIYQRPWNFDYFTSIYRSPIVSSANLQSVLGNTNYSDLDIYTISPFSRVGSSTTVNDNITQFGPSLNSLTSATVRQMFANEKMAMITGRTRKNYDSQVLAHIGIPVPHDVKHDIQMIHHDEYRLQVQEVTSLASTTTSPLGELAGKSYAAGEGKQFKFVAPCHGVVMTIFSVEPLRRYRSSFDRINAITLGYDLPVPEFDRLGNQPMYGYEPGVTLSTSANTDIIGWKERYYSFKRKFDKVTGAFVTPLNTFSGLSNVWASYMLGSAPFALLGGATPNYAIRPDLEQRFYIERSAVDNLCAVPFAYGWHGPDTSGTADPSGEDWSKTPWLVYQRDPFIVNSFIKAKKVSWMSKDGEPIYNY